MLNKYSDSDSDSASDKCAPIDILTKQFDNLQQSMDKGNNRRIIESDSCDYDSSGSDASDSDDEASDDNLNSHSEVLSTNDVTNNVDDKHSRPVSRPRGGAMPCQQFQKVGFTCRIQQITCSFKK